MNSAEAMRHAIRHAHPILATLTPEQTNLLRWRAEGRAWKAICWDLGVSRSTAVRRHRDAELVLLWRLAGGEPEVERLPRRAFRQVVMARLGLA